VVTPWEQIEVTIPNEDLWGLDALLPDGIPLYLYDTPSAFPTDDTFSGYITWMPTLPHDRHGFDRQQVLVDPNDLREDNGNREILPD